jgi:hypothetical protein
VGAARRYLPSPPATGKVRDLEPVAFLPYLVAMTELVRDRWPVLAAQVDAALRAADETVLTELWRDAHVVQECGCEDDFCQSFYTEEPPTGVHGPGHRNVALDAPWPGYLILDVVGEQIMYVEVLYREALN